MSRTSPPSMLAHPSAAAARNAGSGPVRVGTPVNGGHRVNAATPRYRFADGLYLGARWDGCDGTVTIYYGAVVRPRTRLYLYINGQRLELPATPGCRQYTLRDGDFGPGVHQFVIQDVVLGRFTARGRERWTPTISLQVHR